ncbi:MAG: VTT domain-containing protein [Acidobacteriota bacterium]|nr:VTT domain-containing protein [Acidobacteriota bacterium]
MLDTDSLAALGLGGLFLASFLAGTVVAFGSEAVLVALLLLGVAPVPAVAVGSLGNTLGGLTVYALGRAVVSRETTRRWVMEHRWAARLHKADPERLRQAQARLERWGPVALLLSWLPAVGDLLVLAAGLARVGWGRVIFFVAVGKTARYIAFTWAVLAARPG